MRKRLLCLLLILALLLTGCGKREENREDDPLTDSGKHTVTTIRICRRT